MSPKKNKKKNKKPAVGSPAAGSNNKRAKNPPKPSADKRQRDAQKTKSNGANPNKNKKAEKIPQQKNKTEQKKTENQNPPKDQKPKKEKKKKLSFKKLSFKQFAEKYNVGKILAALVIVLGVIAAIVCLVIHLLAGGVEIPDEIKNAEYKGRVESQSVAFDMDISSEQQNILAKAVHAKGNKSAFKFFVNKDIIVDEYNDPALLEFGSVNSNNCVLLVFLIDENGKLLYRSLGVEPGKKISSVYLFDEVPYGEHKLTLIVNGYDPKTNEIIGTQTTDINLKVGS